MILLALILGGRVVGLIVGEWWALIVPAGLGAFVGLTTEVELGGVWLGGGYALASGLGAIAGIRIRRASAGRWA